MVEAEEFSDNYSDDEVDQTSHNKLLSAVSRIYKKQRVDKPKRSEPYSNVSEYHLSNYENDEIKNDKIQVFDLVNVLEKKSTHQKIKSKFDSAKDRSSKLPKPLEKVYTDRIKRSVGYEHLKQHVSRWNDLIQHNRSAPQLAFPLQEEIEVKEYKPLEFLHTFKEPSELEKNMAEVLQQSSVAQAESEVEKAIYNLSIPEMIEKRKLMAKLKAKESFQIVKAMKQNKIKSKKYRRILRKEKLKQELKDFESLQRTDPEAALEKLNKLEKERAEERASLRHRNTGKWARGQAIRARYDKDARIQLAEQISKSRELTQKRKVAGESSSEEEDNDEDNDEQNESKVQDDNPWTQEEQEQTVDEFIAGYQNYWKNKKSAPPQTNPTVNKAALSRLLGKSGKKVQADINCQNDTAPNVNCGQATSNDKSKNHESTLNMNKNPERCSESEDEIVTLDSSKTKKSPSSKKPQPKTIEINAAVKKNNNLSTKSNNSVQSSTDVSGINEFSSSLSTRNNSVKLDKPDIVKTPGRNKKRKSNEVENKKTSVQNVSGSWEVTPEKLKPSKENKCFDDMFDKMADDMQDRVRQRLSKFHRQPDNETVEDTLPFVEKKKKSKKNDKTTKGKKSVGTIIEESSSKEYENKDEELDDILKVIDDGDQINPDDKQKSTKEPTIDPNKFLNVKPRVLNAQVPDMLTDGDDMVDDPEENRRLNISEAFAEDDVVEQFRKEKENEIKNCEGQDVDLFLPGWGAWAGPSIDSKQSMRKRKRFFVKAPELPRRDKAKPNVIINEDISDKYKSHLVSEMPYPFTSVRDYEASIRAPIGSTWMPEAAVKKLTRPPVVKKIGKIIEPMTEASLEKHKKKNLSLKVNNISGGDKIK